MNLLPPKEKEELLLQANKKLVIVLGNVLLISLICLVLVLFSLNFYILGEVNYRKILLDDTKKKYQTTDFLFFKDLIIKYNTSFVAIDSFYKKEAHFSDALKTISEIQRPQGVYLTSINIDAIKEDNQPQAANRNSSNVGSLPSDKAKLKVAVSGMSNTRDNLLIFKDSIEHNKKIVNAYFPPNSWIKPTNINFYLTFEMF